VRQLAGQTDWVYSVAVSPDSKKAAAGGWDGRVVIWNLADGKEEKAFLAAPGRALPPAEAKK
jgi:WD40 repeat protein